LSIFAVVFIQFSCSEWFMEEPSHLNHASLGEEYTANNASRQILSDEVYEKTCIRTEYYFCPGVNGPLMRIKITKDICKDPPTVLSMSECEEYLECNPSHYIISIQSCISEDGEEGEFITYCVKGFIQDGSCNIENIDRNDEEDTYNPNEEIAPFQDTAENESNVSTDACAEEKVDVLLIVDLSGSMISEITAVYDAIVSFSSDFNSSDDIKWSMIVGPKNLGNKPGNNNHLYLSSKLQNIHEFKSSLQSILEYEMIGQYEMMYDALYLAIRNLSTFQPYENDKLVWPTWIGNVIAESIPPLDEFYIDWRKDSKKIVIVFTDEPGQSYLMPTSMIGKTYNTKETVTQEKLVNMLKTIDDLRVYAFTDLGSQLTKDSGWLPITMSTNGEWNELTTTSAEMLGYLVDMIEKETCYDN
jgi:hypothetical protein